MHTNGDTNMNKDMKRLVLFVCAMLMTMVSSADNELKGITLTSEEQKLVNSNNDFAFNLFRAAQTGESLILSPLSITYALGMLNNGAAGETLKQINTVLGFGDAGAEAINAFCRKMLTEAPGLDELTKVMIANTIYVNGARGYVLKEDFVGKARQYYDAEPESRDFGDGKTRDVINQWASDHTAGMIPEILKENEFDADAVSYLLNALYFKGTWTLKFDEKETKEELFDDRYPLPLMHQEKELSYAESDDCQALTLPYGNEAYRMTILLPRQGKSVNDVLQGLTAEKWQYLIWGMGEAIVDLKLPRFETTTSLRLEEIMSDLGMPNAFIHGIAEFPHFCNEEELYIDLMKQVAKIEVNEEGTEAAAVTIIGMKATGMGGHSEPPHMKFHANRPFIYIISEQSTGSIFFIGQYLGNPTSAIAAPRLHQRPASGPLYNLSGQRLSTPPSRGIYINDGKKIFVK